MRILPRRLFVLACGLLLSTAAWAQMKVGVVDMREAVNGTAEVKKAVAALEARFKPRQAEAEKLQKDIAEIQGKLQSLQGKLNQQGEAELVGQGQRKERELRRITEDLDGDLQREQQEIGGMALGRMRAVVQKIAEAQGLDVVVDVSQTLYFKPVLSLTKAAIEAYDKAHPAQ